jgi:hypothetical protein
MNMLQKCRSDLARISQSLTQVFRAQECGCQPQTEETASSNSAMCGCGQDACQIGDGANACQPRSQPITEQVWGER